MSANARSRHSSRTPLWHTLIMLCLAPLSSTSRAAAPEISINQAVALALVGNPGLAEIKARAQALAAVPPQVGALPDPAFSVDLLNVPTRSFSLRQEDMTMMEFGITQTIPFPGKRDLQQKIAEAEALAAADSVEEARLRLVREVKDAWWRLYFYDRALKVVGESEHVLQQLVSNAQARYRVGQGRQQDVQLAQLELSKLKDARLELVAMRHSTAAQFNVLLDRLSTASVALPESAEFDLLELRESNLQEKAQAVRPVLAQRRKMLEAAKSRVDLAQTDLYPDVTLGASYAVRQETPAGQSRSDFASIRLSVNLPIYAGDKQAKAIDQRQSEYLKEQYALEDEHLKVRAEITAKSAEYLHTRERLSLYEHEVIPQARQTLRSLIAGYAVGTAEMSDILKAQLTLLQYQTQYWQSLARTQQILAEVTAATGMEVGHE